MTLDDLGAATGRVFAQAKLRKDCGFGRYVTSLLRPFYLADRAAVLP